MADLSNPIPAERSAGSPSPESVPADVRRADEPTRVGRFVVRRVHRSEIHAAVRLVLGRMGDPADDTAVLDFLRFAVMRRIDLGEMQVAAGAEKGPSEKLVFVAAPIRSPGGSAIVSCTADPDAEVLPAARLALERACTGLAGARYSLAQVLVEAGDATLGRLVRDAGFGPVATLSYMLRSVPANPSAPQLPDGYRLLPFTEAVYPRFRDTVAATYEGSLDCPALNGLRSIDDVMAGHRAAGEFHADLWQLLLEGETAVGAVLLAGVPNRALGEVVYLGLTPGARGRGLSDVLMRVGLASARAHRFDGLTLAVDAENTPAIRLYQRHGMRQVYTREAWMKQLGGVRKLGS
ncbi:MAG: GNAT family N-acetyltransferase [Planctomycetota bacterium]